MDQQKKPQTCTTDSTYRLGSLDTFDMPRCGTVRGGDSLGVHPLDALQGKVQQEEPQDPMLQSFDVAGDGSGRKTWEVSSTATWGLGVNQPTA